MFKINNIVPFYIIDSAKSVLFFALLFLYLFVPPKIYAFEKLNLLFQIGPEIDGDRKNRLKRPSDISISNDGKVYVTDTGNNRVVIFDRKGKNFGSFGKRGSKEGQFSQPWGIAHSREGKVYVVDSGNNRVQVFDSKGAYLFSFGRSGSDRGGLRNPKGIAIDNQDRVVVVDSGNYSISLFTLNGIFLDRFGSRGKGRDQFESPVGVSVDNQDNIYISDEKNKKILVFNYDLQFKGFYSTFDLVGKVDLAFGAPSGVAVDRFGFVTYTDSLNSKVHQIDFNGKEQSVFGSDGEGRGQFKGLRSLSYDENSERLYVADSSNNRIQVFKVKIKGDLIPLSFSKPKRKIEIENIFSAVGRDMTIGSNGNIYLVNSKDGKVEVLGSNGEVKGELGKDSKGKSFLGYPESIIISKTGNFFISDSKNEKMHVLDSDGKKIFEFGRGGTKDGNFRDPKGIAARDDYIVVADSGNSRINILNMDGIFLNSFGKRGKLVREFSTPYDVAIDSEARIWVTDTGNHRIQIFNKAGTSIKTFGREGTYRGSFFKPRSISIDDDKNVYILDGKKSARIQVFNVKGEYLYSFGNWGERRSELKNASNIFVDSTKGIRVYVVDNGNKVIKVFRIRQVPSKPDGLKITADEKNSIITWIKKNKSYTKGFRIYSKKNEKDKFTLIGESKGNRFVADSTIARGAYIYAVSAVSYGALEGDLSSAIDHFRVGYDKFIEGDFTGAIENFEKVVDKNPANINALLSLGDAYYGLKEFEKAKEIFVNLTKIDDFYFEGMLRLGELYVKEGRYESAQQIYEEVLEKSPSQIKAYSEGMLRLGELYVKEGKYEFAQQIYEEVLEKSPSQIKAYSEGMFRLGELYVKAGKYEFAQQIYEQVLEKSPSQIKAYSEGMFRLGELYVKEGKYRFARTVFKDILEKFPSQIKAKRYLAEIYIQDGLYQLALNVLDEAIKEGLEDVKAYELIGLIYFNTKMFNKAELFYQKALKIQPDLPSLHLGLGQVFEAKGETEKAIEKYNKVINLDPKNVDAYVRLADQYITNGNLSNAESSLKSAIYLDPINSDAYYLRGTIFMASGNHEDAVSSFRTAILFNAKHREALINISRAYVKIGLIDEAIKHLKRLAILPPRDSEVFFMLANLQNKTGSQGTALRNFVICTLEAPDHIGCRKGAAAIYLDKGNLEKATKHLREIARISPSDPASHISLAKVLKSLGKTGEAIIRLEKAITLDERNGEAKYHLGTIYFKNKQVMKAIEHFEAAVLFSPKEAEYYNGLGLAYLSQVMLDDAIEAFKTANSIVERERYKENLNLAYKKKKKILTASSQSPPLEIVELELKNVFASTYKFYAQNPIGTIKITNNSDDVFKNIIVGLNVKKYMDFPSETLIAELKPHKTTTIHIKPTFNNALLEITEDILVRAEINVEYFRYKKQFSLKRTESFTMYNRNAMTWGRKDMAAAFITPKDTPVVSFARGILQMLNNEDKVLDKNMNKAIQLFNALGALDIIYLVDPINPYADVSVDYERIDSVQYPRDTLKYKTGDCDDLVTLYSALLENVGVETAMLDIPGHLFMAFKTNTFVDEGNNISAKKDLYIVRDDGYIWIPVEVTMVGKSFTEAWYEGAKEATERQRKGELSFIDTHEAWKNYKPVTLEEKQNIQLPKKEKVVSLLERDLLLQKRKGIEKLTKKYLDILIDSPNDYTARLNLGIIYGENSYFDDALKEFNKLLAQRPEDLPILNNIGNVFFEQNNYKQALIYYEKAEAVDYEDAAIKMNLSLVNYKLGNFEEARKKFREGEEFSKETTENFSLLKSLLFD